MHAWTQVCLSARSRGSRASASACTPVGVEETFLASPALSPEAGAASPPREWGGGRERGREGEREVESETDRETDRERER